MPHDLRAIDIYVDERFLATAVDQQRLTDEDKQRALEQRHADADAIRKRAAKAPRSARVRVAPITTAGHVEDITADAPSADPPTPPGVLRLLGREERLNQARENRAGP